MAESRSRPCGSSGPIVLPSAVCSTSSRSPLSRLLKVSASSVAGASQPRLSSADSRKRLELSSSPKGKWVAGRCVRSAECRVMSTSATILYPPTSSARSYSASVLS